MNFSEILNGTLTSSGFANITDIRQIIMLLLAFFLLYLGIVKKFEPMLLVGIAFGMLLTNLPVTGIYHPELWTADKIDYGKCKAVLDVEMSIPAQFLRDVSIGVKDRCPITTCLCSGGNIMSRESIIEAAKKSLEA